MNNTNMNCSCPWFLNSSPLHIVTSHPIVVPFLHPSLQKFLRRAGLLLHRTDLLDHVFFLNTFMLIINCNGSETLYEPTNLEMGDLKSIVAVISARSVENSLQFSSCKNWVHVTLSSAITDRGPSAHKTVPRQVSLVLPRDFSCSFQVKESFAGMRLWESVIQYHFGVSLGWFRGFIVEGILHQLRGD